MLRNSFRRAFVGLAFAATGAVASADVTTASITIGGPGSCSSEGFNDPGRLGDGITEASAFVAFSLDNVANTLTVAVQNTSPVVTGVPNPVLSDLYFSTPLEVTGMTLVSQRGRGGPAPLFELTFDADLATRPNPNGAAGFGAFSVRLDNPAGVAGSIANPAADTLPGPPGSLVIGYVTFELDLTGDLSGIDALDIAKAFSVIPPGDKPTHGVAHFQAGGDASASAFISDAPEDCFVVIGSSPGTSSYAPPSTANHTFEVNLADVRRLFGTTRHSFVQVPLLPFRSGGRFELDGATTTPGTGVGVRQVDRYALQVLMWNPSEYPENPEQWSKALEVRVFSDGTYAAFWEGDEDGIAVEIEDFVAPNGQRYLRFPFSFF